jgi:hypothetical protein
MTPPGDRHGDTLTAQPVPSMRDLLGDETSEKVAAACRFTGLQFQVLKDRPSSLFMKKIARLFE